MQDILFKVFNWLISPLQVKFVMFTAIFAAFNYFTDKVSAYLSPYIGLSALNSTFLAIPPSVWYFIDAMNLVYGLPLLISAACIRFLIRRIPFVG